MLPRGTWGPASSRTLGRWAPRRTLTVSAGAAVAAVALQHAASVKMLLPHAAAVKTLLPLAPIASISHAWQLVARGAVRTFDAYEGLLDRYPLPVKMATGAFGTFLGDLLAQYSTHFIDRRNAVKRELKRQELAAAALQDAQAIPGVDLAIPATAAVSAPLPRFSYQWQRAMRYILFYTFIATPVDVYYYDWLDQVILPDEPNSVQAAVGKMLADELFTTPLMTMGLFAFVKTLEGKPEKAIPFIKDNLWLTLMANYQIWPLAQVVNFLLVPAADRILYIEVVSVFWVAFLSFVVNSKEDVVVPDAAAVEAARVAAVQDVEAASSAMAAHMKTLLTHSLKVELLTPTLEKDERKRGIAVASATLSAAVAYASAALTASTAILVAMESDVGNFLIMAGVSGTDMAVAGVLVALAVTEAAMRYYNLEKEGREQEAAHDRAVLAGLVSGQYKLYQSELERRAAAQQQLQHERDSVTSHSSDSDGEAPLLHLMAGRDGSDGRQLATASSAGSLDEGDARLPSMSGKQR